jgi:hypothetical protein
MYFIQRRKQPKGQFENQPARCELSRRCSGKHCSRRGMERYMSVGEGCGDIRGSTAEWLKVHTQPSITNGRWRSGKDGGVERARGNWKVDGEEGQAI